MSTDNPIYERMYLPASTFGAFVDASMRMVVK